MRLYSGATICGVTGVFHFSSNLLLKEGGVTTSHYVHPCLGMQVDAKCMKRQKHDGDRKLKQPHFFSFLSFVWAKLGVSPLQFPLLLFKTLTINAFIAAQPESPTSLTLHSLYTPCLFIYIYCSTTLVAPLSFLEGPKPSKMALQMEMSHRIYKKVHWTSY